jgi:hypothetical protein
MTKKEQDYLENLEECFYQLLSSYEYSQIKIKDLESTINFLKELCKNNFIEIPDIDSPIPF